jgi:hypothetical protein
MTALDTGTPAGPLIVPTKRTAYYAPTAGRHYFSKAAAYRNEAKARFYACCECEDGLDHRDPGYTCGLHRPKYTDHRESDGTSLTGRVIRRWAKLLAARDRAAAPS